MQPKPLFKGGISIKGVTFVLRPDSPLAKVIAAIRVNVKIAENYANGEELISFAGVNVIAPSKKTPRIRPASDTPQLETGGDAVSEDLRTE
jgi:hypothetical protein